MDHSQTSGIKGTASANLSFIRSVYPSLTKAEQKVADLVLEDGQRIIYGSITDLAHRAGVGDTSVLRFCRSVGFSGFQEFKLTLAQELIRAETGSPEVSGGNSENLIDRIIYHNIRLLEETARLLETSKLEQSARFMLQADKIVFFGVGSSGLTASEAVYQFVRLGLPVEAVAEGHLGLSRASTLSCNELAVVFSVSGSTYDAVEIARIAKQNNATVVCMTGYARSPVAAYSDSVIVSPVWEEPAMRSSLPSKMVQLCVLDLIFESVRSELGPRADESLQKTAKAVSRRLI